MLFESIDVVHVDCEVTHYLYVVHYFDSWQRALMNLDNLQRLPGRMEHSPMRERRFTASRSSPFPTKRNQLISFHFAIFTCVAVVYMF